MSPRIATQTRRVPNQYSIERLNTLLTELQNKRTELLTKFKPGDRMVVQVDQQIADTLESRGDRRAAQPLDRRGQRRQPAAPGSESELTRVEANSAGLRGRIQEMKAQAGEYRRDLARIERLLPQEQERLRNVRVAEDNYLLYTKKREEARIGERMDQQKIANVVLAEPALAPLLPKSRLSPAVITAYLLGLILIGLFGLLLGRRAAP